MAYKSGFCGAGLHEGERLRSPSGAPLKVCTMWEVCNCDCHDLITRMYEQAEQPREPVQNPDYIPYVPEFTLVSKVGNLGLSAITGLVNAPDTPENAVASRSAAASGVLATPDAEPSREMSVKEITDAFALAGSEELCTPNYISDEIARLHHVPPPSTGAIHAVLNRWEAQGFAIIGHKPMRFISYTVDGLKIGLDGCKEVYKRRQRRIK
jgi:hypothetical protein